MLHVFGGLKQLLSVSNAGTNPQTEGVVSKVHYRLTALVFLVSCILLTSIEFVWNGMAISCIQDVSCILVTSIEFVWNGMAISCIQDGC